MTLPAATAAPARPDASFAAPTRGFLLWVACCNFVTVAAATYLFWDEHVVLRVLSALAALAVGLIAAFGIPFLATWADAPSAPVVQERRPDLRDEQLTAQLALGTGLHRRVQQGVAGGPQIESWIDQTRALLDESRPDLADYFATDTHDTAETNWPSKLEDAIKLSQLGRLDRHLERLSEILSGRAPS